MANKRFSSGQGPSQRQLRVGELIRRVISDVLSRGEIHDPALNAMPITVGEVACSADLRVCTVYVMPLLGSAPVEEAIKALARNTGEMRHRIGKEVTLRHVPELRFRPDETFDRLDEARRLFSDPAVRRDVEAKDPPEDGGEV
ncbi:MAG: 30S ribosome-binding factor RbfA [Paracoccaceae bacterium]